MSVSLLKLQSNQEVGRSPFISQRLLSNGPAMGISPAEELAEHDVAQEDAVQAAAENAMLDTGVS